MRITLVTDCFYPAVDGSTVTVRSVADHLIDAGHLVQILAPAPGLTSYRGGPVSRVRMATHPGRQVRDALSGFGPDLVQVFGTGPLCRKALKHTTAPTVTTQVGPVPDPLPSWWGKLVTRSTVTLATCTWVGEQLAGLGLVAPTWTPGVDARAFTPALRDPWLHAHWSRSRSRRRPLVVVGFVGDLRKEHGVRRLVALGALPGIRLIVIGDGPERAWLSDRLPKARFTGALETGDLARAMASFDALVHPGDRLTCAHALRAAAASGLPVIAARGGGAPDVVRHLETGLLHRPGDVADLRRAMASLAADPRRHLLGEAGRAQASRRTWDAAVAELLTVHYPAALRSHSGLRTAA